MALSHDWIINSASFLWILTLFLGESQSKRTQTYYMDGMDCGKTLDLGGAIVFSHHFYMSQLYNHSVRCTLTFKAQNAGWKLMLRVLELDIPDRRYNGYCNDALWVYDADSIYTKAMVEAGDNIGLCGHKLPSTLYSTGKYMTLHFGTNKKGKRGKGFKFVITAFSEDFSKYNSCGSSFLCDNKRCIDEDLTCDRVDHCGDYSDEAADGTARCGEKDNHILEKFLSLGVAASIAIIVGGLLVFIVCIAAIVCCCRRCICKQDPASSSVTSPPSSVVANGNPGITHGNGHAQQDRGMNLQHQTMSPFTNPTHQGYYPMQPIYPSPHGSVQGSVYSAYTRDSGFTHNHFVGGHTSSVYSSQAPSYHGHRSHTPTSSKSGKSHHSNNSVKYSHSNDKVMLPVNL